MKVVMLCGGAGKRMFPVTEDKVLLDFIGRSLLEHQIAAARSAGIREFVIIGNPGNIDQLRQIAAGINGIDVTTVVQENPNGISGALQSARELLTSPLIVVNPNDLFDTTVYEKLSAPGCQDVAAVLMAYKVDSYFPGGYLVTDDMGYLKEIVEKPAPGSEPSHLVTMLAHRHNDIEKLSALMKNQTAVTDDVYERALQDLVRDNGRIKVVQYTGVWTAIKYPWHILEAAKYFLQNSKSRVSPEASISPLATIDGEVIIEAGVRILENTVIRGPVYIGRNTIIGNNCLVRGYSHIGPDCVVGFGTEIKGSYIGRGCRFHMNYIGDSVIGENCVLGAGTITSNWRFDEKPVSVDVQGKRTDTGRSKFGAVIGNHCKIGINVSLMPGVKIAPGSAVMPGITVMKDIKGKKN